MSSPVSQVLALPEEFLQPALSELKKQVDEIATTGNQTVLDAQPVARFDGAALQFLIAFANCSISASPCMTSTSGLLSKALADIGVDPQFIAQNFKLADESSDVSI